MSEPIKFAMVLIQADGEMRQKIATAKEIIEMVADADISEEYRDLPTRVIHLSMTELPRE